MSANQIRDCSVVLPGPAVGLRLKKLQCMNKIIFKKGRKRKREEKFRLTGQGLTTEKLAALKKREDQQFGKVEEKREGRKRGCYHRLSFISLTFDGLVSNDGRN